MTRDDESIDRMLKEAFDDVRADDDLKRRTSDAVLAQMRELEASKVTAQDASSAKDAAIREGAVAQVAGVQDAEVAKAAAVCESSAAQAAVVQGADLVKVAGTQAASLGKVAGSREDESTKAACVPDPVREGNQAPSASPSAHSRMVRSLWRRIAPLAACLAILAIACIGGWRLYFTPAVGISIDVNPSVELGVNCFDRVISVDAYNDDGQQLIDSLDADVVNMEYEDAVDCILASPTIQNLLAEGEQLSVAVAGDDDVRCENVAASVESSAAEHGAAGARCHRVDADEVESAHHEGLSFGKYQAYLEAHECDPSLTAEDAHHMTMRELHDVVREHDGEGGHHGRRSGNAEVDGSDSDSAPSGSAADASGGDGGASGASNGASSGGSSSQAASGEGHRHGARAGHHDE